MCGETGGAGWGGIKEGTDGRGGYKEGQLIADPGWSGCLTD